MSEPRTVGEKVARDGLCLAMLRMAELAEVSGRIPCGEWDYTLTSDPRWRICLNGGTTNDWQPRNAMPIPRFNAYVEFNGWPAGLLDAAGGTMVGSLEGDLIAALDKEIHALGPPGPPVEPS